MFALKNLKVFVEKNLVNFEFLIWSYLSLRIVCGIYQMIKYYFLTIYSALRGINIFQKFL
jgi:hypothetical protein